ncbi:MAG: hypothetical protein SFW08_02365 [Gemmatimonadaceae bacterium]|nr:hypothetical protein [Gemmatimonadaceae bacterium]
MRRMYWVAVLVLPIAMMTPWSDTPIVGFALGLALGLAGTGLVVSLTTARQPGIAETPRRQS